MRLAAGQARAMGTTGTREYLGIYLNDHLAGAAGGVELAFRAAQARRNSSEGEQLRRLAADIASDRGALLSIMRSLRIPARRYKSMAAWVAEKAARLKLNGRLLSRSPLSDLVELEGLRLAVEGKAAGWRTLLGIADQEPGLDADRLQELVRRANAQISRLEELRVTTAAELFSRASTAGSARLPSQ
jgi:hypothetical protein